MIVNTYQSEKYITASKEDERSQEPDKIQDTREVEKNVPYKQQTKKYKGRYYGIDNH